MALKELVEDAFRNAKENGVDFFESRTAWPLDRLMNDEEIAVDMLDYDASIQEFGASVEEVQAEVKAYREKVRGS